MIQLHSDYLVFEVSGGTKIPCSVEKLTIEILGDSLDRVDPEVIRQAATAVLHYFREDLARESVTVDEFTAALEQVLIGLGFQVHGALPVPSTLPGPASPTEASSSANATPDATPTQPSVPAPIAEADLEALIGSLDEGLELSFYARLRIELRNLLATTPRLVRFRGLRPCAKRLARARRWCPRSLEVSDEIVGYLRACLGAEHPQTHCALVVN